jgi:hypothetical protein
MAGASKAGNHHGQTPQRSEHRSFDRGAMAARLGVCAVVTAMLILGPIPVSHSSHTCNQVTSTHLTTYPDFYFGSSGIDTIHALDGDDYVEGAGSGDNLCGDEDEDWLLGQAGADFRFSSPFRG